MVPLINRNGLCSSYLNTRHSTNTTGLVYDFTVFLHFQCSSYSKTLHINSIYGDGTLYHACICAGVYVNLTLHNVADHQWLHPILSARTSRLHGRTQTFEVHDLTPVEHLGDTVTRFSYSPHRSPAMGTALMQKMEWVITTVCSFPMHHQTSGGQQVIFNVTRLTVDQVT